MGEKREYTLSEKALEQRRQAAAQSTGPRTEEGKARSSRNNWKTGMYSAVNQRQLRNALVSVHGKPCRTTCPKHPDNPESGEHPCSLVLDGLTQAGGDCLDKEVFVDAFGSIMEALERGEMDGMHGLMASQVAGAVEILDQLRREIREHGIVTPVYAVTKEGKVVTDPDDESKPLAVKYELNPAVMQHTILLDKLGLNLGEALVTPRSKARAGVERDGADKIQEFLGLLGQRAGDGQPPGRLLEHESDETEEGEDAG